MADFFLVLLIILAYNLGVHLIKAITQVITTYTEKGDNNPINILSGYLLAITMIVLAFEVVRYIKEFLI